VSLGVVYDQNLGHFNPFLAVLLLKLESHPSYPKQGL